MFSTQVLKFRKKAKVQIKLYFFFKKKMSQKTFSVNITPTVELNALAMKRGEPAVYTFLDTVRPHGQQVASGNNAFNFRGMYNQR